MAAVKEKTVHVFVAGITNIILNSSLLNQRILWFVVRYVQETSRSRLLLYLFQILVVIYVLLMKQSDERSN